MATAQVLPNSMASTRKLEHLEAGKRRLEEFRKKKAAERVKKAAPPSQNHISDVGSQEKKPLESEHAQRITDSDGATTTNGAGRSAIESSSALVKHDRHADNFSQNIDQNALNEKHSYPFSRNGDGVFSADPVKQPSNGQEIKTFSGSRLSGTTHVNSRNDILEINKDSNVIDGSQARISFQSSFGINPQASEGTDSIISQSAHHGVDGLLFRRDSQENSILKSSGSVDKLSANISPQNTVGNLQDTDAISNNLLASGHSFPSSYDGFFNSTNRKGYSSHEVGENVHRNFEFIDNQTSDLEQRKPIDVTDFTRIKPAYVQSSESAGLNADIRIPSNYEPAYTASSENSFRRSRPSFLDSLTVPKAPSGSFLGHAERDKASRISDGFKVEKDAPVSFFFQNPKKSDGFRTDERDGSESLTLQRPLVDVKTVGASSDFTSQNTPVLNNNSFPPPIFSGKGVDQPITGMEDTMERKHELYSSKQNEDFAALEQHIEDLTQEKFSLQRALEASRTLAESLAAENSSLTDSYNKQRSVVNQLKSDMEMLQEEMKMQMVELESIKLEYANAQLECNAADERAVRCAAQSLLASKKYTALMKLLTIFNSVEWPFVSMIKTMAQWKNWSAAELFARTFGSSDDKDLAKALVDEAIAIQDVKRAHRIVHNFNLQEEYPDIDLLYCHDGLMKLIERQRWQMALSFAGNDVTLQKLLFDHLMAAGEIQWASRLAQILEISDFETRVGELVAQRGLLRTNGLSYSATAAALNGCLSLELGSESIVFCDTEESLRSAMKHFFGDNNTERDSTSNGFHADQIVGLDVEWKPTSTKIAATTGSSTTTAVASILQISSSSRAFIIDLLSLRDSNFLFEIFLGRLFTCRSLLKVGFGFDTDLKVLHQTFPERSALTNISPFLELSVVVSKLLGVTVGNSLSNAARMILGSPLDKRMQMSNWDVRPLTATQLTYAALDAYCLVQIMQKLLRNEEERLPSWQSTAAEIHTLTYSSPLTDAEASEAIALREKYCQDWMESKTRITSGDVVASMLTPHDVEEFWEERKRKHQEEDFDLLQTRAAAVAEVLDTTLTFLDPLTVKSLLGQSKDSEKPVTFVAVNTICFFAEEKPCVACIEANCKLDTAQLAALCGVSRRRIKLATPAECCEYFGFEPGTIPPFGHRSARADREQQHHPIHVYASHTLQYVESLVCGGGSHDALLWLNSKAYFALIDVEAIGDIQRGLSAVEAPTPGEEAAALNADQTQHEPIREYKFLADSMVARVGKWLRTIGMDVIIWDPYSVPKKTASQDHKAALLALSVCEQRILLTRDKKLADRRDAGACFVVSSDDPYKQFQEIKTHFALKLVKEEMMSRCSRCNAKGFNVVDLDYVRNQTEDEVHPNVLEVVTEFWVCRVCHKIYWEGPKYDSNYANLLRMFDEDSIVEK